MPGGAVTRQAYESLVNKTLDSLRKHLPYHGLLFDIHGAMSVVGLDDPEGDFIKRIREVIGSKPIISTSMDLHGNVSMSLAKNSDLITCYRMAPHEDAMDTKKRAVENLLQRIESGKGKPAFKAYTQYPFYYREKNQYPYRARQKSLCTGSTRGIAGWNYRCRYMDWICMGHEPRNMRW